MEVLKNTAIDNKAGRRLAQSQVDQLKEAIGILLNVAGYVNYEDEVEQLLEDVADENKQQEIALESEDDDDQKIFADDCNEKCFGFKVLQGESETYLLTWTTNAYEDREGETFTLKSLQNYVNENDEKSEKGTYQFWHTEGSDFADIMAQMVTGKFLVELGKFRKDDIGKAFKQFFLKYPTGHKMLAPNGWGCSHGFVYRKADREDGVYEWFDKKETTILPLEEAANVFTLMEVL